ncbi:hypothetical protein FNV43_RR00553 [Rhamnella rubrinervis]|uniref:Thioredoxin-like protein YLS8 n=1 Tax=Rhamnella rubrinervis TaxID=2594499 RepID=A0A8K0HQL7_9ROSA|nr:hypothetical protein FNV43_RR00553 [Rhamnella rubrinervis]
MLDLDLFLEYLDRAAVLQGLRRRIQRSGGLEAYLKLYFYRNSTFDASPSLPAPICTPSLPPPICNMDMEGVGTVEVHRKGQKFYRKKEKVEDMENHQSDDGREACSGTEEGLNVNVLKGKVDEEFSNAKAERFSPQGQRKRSKNLFFGGWAVDQAILAEEERVVVIRFGHDWDDTCMQMDKVLASVAETIKNFAVIYLVDITEVPDFNTMYELYDPSTVMFFFRNKHIMIDLGTGNNNKINWALKDKQEFIDIVETVYRGARKGRGLVIAPKDYSTKYRY